MDKLIIPNYHAILIHFPLGMLGLGIAIELFSFLGWQRSPFRHAGRWIILLGTLALVPAWTSGLYALSNVVSHGNGIDSWIESSTGSGFTNYDWSLVRYHVMLNSIATLVALVAVVLWVGASDRWREILRVPSLLMLIVAMGLMTDGAWHGGEMVYRRGFGVQQVKSVQSDVPLTSWKQKSPEEKIGVIMPAGEMHLLFVGFTFMLTAMALALTMRRSFLDYEVLEARVPPTVVRAGDTEDMGRPISLLQALNAPADEIAVSPGIPSARFWMFASVAVLVALASGLWFGDYLGPWPHMSQKIVRAVKSFVQDPVQGRQGIHIILGASILLLILIMALLARFVPRGRVLLSAFSFVLLLAMAAQLWVGVLLLFDGGHGTLKHFKSEAELNAPNPSTAPSAPPLAEQ